MKQNEKLYLVPEDLYRLGNASSPLLTRIRPGEVDLIELNGIKMVVANGKGISLYNKVGLNLLPLTGWVWEISARRQLPFGLKLVKDDKPEGRYTICPNRNMSVHEFVGLLESIVIYCKKVYKKKA
ncbi:MAG: hypothetical protein GY706_13630 [Bacteroides sp.]|nr:hypothetical protein [Bacteroides sp.]